MTGVRSTTKIDTLERVRVALRAEGTASVSALVRRLRMSYPSVEAMCARGVAAGWAVEVSAPDRPAHGPGSARYYRFTRAA